MKEIKEMRYYESEYDFNIRGYLTNAEIDAIAKGVIQFKSWAERKETKDALILHFATDIGDENIENIGISELTKAGIIDIVYSHVFNAREIEDAIKYEESSKMAFELARQLQDVEKAVKKNGGKTRSKK